MKVLMELEGNVVCPVADNMEIIDSDNDDGPMVVALEETPQRVVILKVRRIFTVEERNAKTGPH